MTDRNRASHGVCSAVVGNLTMAQKAQRALSAAAIPSSLDKSKTSSSRHGCVWSVRFSCGQYPNVRSVFADANIKVMAWENEDDIF